MKQTGFFLRSNWSTIVIGVAAISAGAAAVEFKSQIVNSIAAQGVSLSASLIASNLLVTFLPALVISLANNNLRRNIISGLSTISIFAVGLWKMTSMEFSKEENEYVKNIWDRKNQDLTTEIILSRRSVMTKFLPAIVLGFASLLAMNFMRAFANAAAPAQAQAQAQVDNVPARPAVEPHETSTFSQGRRRQSSLSSARPTALPNAPAPDNAAVQDHNSSSASGSPRFLSNVSLVSGSLLLSGEARFTRSFATPVVPHAVSHPSPDSPVHASGVGISPVSARRGSGLSMSDLNAHGTPVPVVAAPSRHGFVSVARNVGDAILRSPVAVAVGNAARTAARTAARMVGGAGRTVYGIAKTLGFQGAEGVVDRASLGGTQYPQAVHNVGPYELRGPVLRVKSAMEAALAAVFTPPQQNRKRDDTPPPPPGGRTNKRNRPRHVNAEPDIPPAAKPVLPAEPVVPSAAQQGGERRSARVAAGILGNGPSAGARAKSSAPSAGARAKSGAPSNRWR